MKKPMNLFTLIWVASAFSISMRNLPLIAKTQLQMFFFAVVAILFFFIPIALTSAELATGWPKMGGIVIWVKEAFGKKWGLVAIWLQWVYMNIGVIAMLYFISGSIAYTFAPHLVENLKYLIPIILVIIWLFTYLNLKGISISSKISKIFFIIGILTPAIILIILGALHLLEGGGIKMNFSASYLPDFKHFSTIVLLVGFMRTFGGIEGAAVHANSVDNPQRNYPIAIGFVVVMSILINVLGAFSLSIALPQDDIILIGGVMKAFTFYLSKYNLQTLVPILGVLAAIGQIGGFSTWIGGPVKGLLETAKEGELPKFFQKVNDRGAPRNLLLIQAVIISISSSLFLLLATSVNMSFWISVALSMMVYFTMYILMLISCLYLRYTKPEVARKFKIPFKNVGVCIVTISGIFIMLFGFFIALMPPSQLETQNYIKYIAILLTSIAVIYTIPFIIHKLKNDSWKIE